MKINSKIGKKPSDMEGMKFAAMKKIIKQDLKRLEKNTSAASPTTFMLVGIHNYPDKKEVALPIFGKQTSEWKQHAKNVVAKDDTGVLGRVYFNGVNSDGQKVVVFDLAKGKGKGKTPKLTKGIKKIIPQSTYDVVFNEVDESVFDTLDSQLDAAGDTPEVEVADNEDEGDVDVDTTQNYPQLLATNLKKISDQFVPIRNNANNKIDNDQEDVDILVDYATEWLELYSEADLNTKEIFGAKLSQIEAIKTFALNLSSGGNPHLKTAESSISSVVQKGSKGPDVVTVQNLLLKNGEDLGKWGADGDAGNTTVNAINSFQSKKGITPNGKVAPNDDTWKALNGQTINPNPNPNPQDNKTYDTAAKAAEFAKTLHQDPKYWIDVKLTDAGKAFYKTADATRKYPSSDHPTVKTDLQKGYIKQHPKYANYPDIAKTWCNQLAYRLGDEVLGEANPFNLLPMGEGWTNANALKAFMDKADGVLVDKVKGQGRFEKAWAEINKGKMVYFCEKAAEGSGHVATGIPTKELRICKHDPKEKVGKVTQAGAKVGEYYIDDIWGSSKWSNVEIYVGRFQEPLPNNAKPDPNLHLAMYDKITHPIGQGKVMGAIGTLYKTYTNPEELQNVIASIRTVQQLLANAGQPVTVDANCGNGTVTAIKNIQLQIQQPQSGFIEMNDPTWNFLMGKSSALIQAAVQSTLPKQENPTPTELTPDQVTISPAAGVPAIPAAKLAVLKEVLAKAGEPNAVITSYSRTAEEQARIMFNNIVKDGEAKNRSSYKNPAAASTVVDAFMKALNAGKNGQEIYAAVLAAVNQVGAASLSDHCGSNPAIDIDPASLKNKGNFETALKADSRIQSVTPPADPLYHLIIA